jgi:hypothetical protein
LQRTGFWRDLLLFYVKFGGWSDLGLKMILRVSPRMHRGRFVPVSVLSSKTTHSKRGGQVRRDADLQESYAVVRMEQYRTSSAEEDKALYCPICTTAY